MVNILRDLGDGGAYILLHLQTGSPFGNLTGLSPGMNETFTLKGCKIYFHASIRIFKLIQKAVLTSSEVGCFVAQIHCLLERILRGCPVHGKGKTSSSEVSLVMWLSICI